MTDRTQHTIRLVRFALAGMAISGAALILFSISTVPFQPVSVSPKQVVFQLRAGESATTNVLLRNDSNRSVTIRGGGTSCSCIRAKPDKRQIEPGQKCPIALTIKRKQTGSFRGYAWLEIEEETTLLTRNIVVSINATIDSP